MAKRKRVTSLENSLVSHQPEAWLNTDLKVFTLSFTNSLSLSPGTRHLEQATQHGLLHPEAKLPSSYPGLMEPKWQDHPRGPAIGKRSRYKKLRGGCVS